MAIVGGGALSAAHVLSNRIGRFYFMGLAVLFLLGAVWRLFWRVDLEIDVLQRSYLRRRGDWARIRTHCGPLDDINALRFVAGGGRCGDGR